MTVKEIFFGTKDYQNALDLRYRILRKPLNLKFTDDFLAQDKYQIHIAAFDNEQIVGCLILKIVDNKTLKMRQVAVDENLQGKGIGKEMVKFSEKFVIDKGFSKIELHARLTAVPFYLSLNYTVEGQEFTEVGISHIKMYKQFNNETIQQ